MGTPLAAEKVERIKEAWKIPGMTVESVAQSIPCDRKSARKYRPPHIIPSYNPPKIAAPAPESIPARPATLPTPVSEAGGPSCPEPFELKYDPFIIDSNPANWLVLSDIHIPYHDRHTVETAVREGKARGARGIILNGDILDFYQISKFSRRPDRPRFKEEILKGRQLLDWLRGQFPDARIIFKEGNHDERLMTYLADRAPEIFDLDDVHLPNLLRADNYGVEWVSDRRVIELGKLPIIHGHEYAGGGGVMPARWLFIRAWSNALMGHFHHPSHYPVPTLDRRELGVWSTGCCCFLHPYFRPQNTWRHGFAHVKLENDGRFEVSNREILRDGKVTG